MESVFHHGNRLSPWRPAESRRTIQAHLTAIKGFTKWLTENHKLTRDPLVSIRKPSPRTDRRRERRMLLPEEWRRLATTTEAGPERFGVPAAERLLLYRTAIQTGLRSGELRSLTGRQLHLDVASPFVLCRAMSAKNRREARQHIPRDLADALPRHVEDKAITSPVFAMPHESNVARMLREDLDAARAAWLNEARTDADEYRRRERSDFLAGQSASGEVVDFHCLRHVPPELRPSTWSTSRRWTICRKPSLNLPRQTRRLRSAMAFRTRGHSRSMPWRRSQSSNF